MKKIVIICLMVTLFGVARVSVAAPTLDQQTPEGFQLVPNLPSGQPVGTEVIWDIIPVEPLLYEYRLSYIRGNEDMQIMYDYGTKQSFEWVPLEEGFYVVVASIREKATGEINQLTKTFILQPRATTAPVVSPTAHPLVALYSAPACTAGNQLRVVFLLQGGTRVASTDMKPCQTGHSLNFYVGGMRPQSLYWIIQEEFDAQGNHLANGPLRYFVTGALGIEMPTLTVTVPPDPAVSYAENVVLHSGVYGSGIINRIPPFPYATDLAGRTLWYYALEDPNEANAMLFYPGAGGTFMMKVDVGDYQARILREVDLAGNVVRETNVDAINAQLAAMGYSEPFTSFHHESLPLPNGDVAVLGSVERILVDVQGPGAVDVLGDYVVVLDSNWQVKWVWNAFDHLDTYRLAVLGEVCQHQSLGCPPVFLDAQANDWTHANAIDYSDDGNLLVSLRHQDWIVKIDYQDGLGDGHVIWTLGPEGDFTLDNPDPDAWFTHQHDARIVGADQVVLYDNGNTRCGDTPLTCRSRGQALQIDEQGMTATLTLSVELPQYSFALGSAQRLFNGDYHFGSGVFLTQGPTIASAADEYDANGNLLYTLQSRMPSYRSFRMINLYTHPGGSGLALPADALFLNMP